LNQLLKSSLAESVSISVMSFCHMIEPFVGQDGEWRIEFDRLLKSVLGEQKSELLFCPIFIDSEPVKSPTNRDSELTEALGPIELWNSSSHSVLPCVPNTVCTPFFAPFFAPRVYQMSEVSPSEPRKCR